MNSKTLFLVDGSYFAYRSFYAIREMNGGGDMKHNAVFGFSHDLRRMAERVRPGLTAVVWDAGLPQARLELLPDYKQQRNAMPVELKEQLPVIKKACEAFGWTNLSLPGNEADDLIATYARHAEKNGLEVVIATNDKDIFQLVGERIKIYTTAKKHLPEGQGHALLGEADVERIWGVKPSLIKDILILTGDSSDNIPGVPGIGPKTAVKLIRAAGNLDELQKDPHRHANPRIAGLLLEHTPTIEKNKKLIQLDEGLEMPVGLEGLHHKFSHDNAISFADSLGFRSISRELARGGRREDSTQGNSRGAEKPGYLQSELGF